MIGQLCRGIDIETVDAGVGVGRERAKHAELSRLIILVIVIECARIDPDPAVYQFGFYADLERIEFLFLKLDGGRPGDARRTER